MYVCIYITSVWIFFKGGLSDKGKSHSQDTNRKENERPKKTIGAQTIQAAQQLGVLVIYNINLTVYIIDRSLYFYSLCVYEQESFNYLFVFPFQIAVGIMVVVLFFIIVYIEVFCKMMQAKLKCGNYKKEDIEDQDPASLVGTFKRYKWFNLLKTVSHNDLCPTKTRIHFFLLTIHFNV